MDAIIASSGVLKCAFSSASCARRISTSGLKLESWSSFMRSTSSSSTSSSELSSSRAAFLRFLRSASASSSSSPAAMRRAAFARRTCVRIAVADTVSEVTIFLPTDASGVEPRTSPVGSSDRNARCNDSARDSALVSSAWVPSPSCPYPSDPRVSSRPTDAPSISTSARALALTTTLHGTTGSPLYAASSCRYRVKPVPNMCCVASKVGSSKVMSRNL